MEIIIIYFVIIKGVSVLLCDGASCGALCGVGVL